MAAIPGLPSFSQERQTRSEPRRLVRRVPSSAIPVLATDKAMNRRFHSILYDARVLRIIVTFGESKVRFRACFGPETTEEYEHAIRRSVSCRNLRSPGQVVANCISPVRRLPR